VKGPAEVVPMSALGNAGGGTRIQIVDQRQSGAAIRPETQRGPSGETIVRVLVRDEVGRMSRQKSGRGAGLNPALLRA
jgi:hypothetical protein